MEFRGLKRQYQALKEQIDAAIFKVLEEGTYIGGPTIEELEKQLAAYVGTEDCITCGNGTDALSLLMMAWEIGRGDAVFLPDFTFFATGEAVALAGAVPIFVDVEADTFEMSMPSLEQAVREIEAAGELRPRAILAVDLFGLPADYPAMGFLANQYDMLILEDGAQGFGGSRQGRKACGFGDAAITSFFPSKPLGCYGDGGAVFTDHKEKAALIRSLKVHGKGKNKYENLRIGINSRLDVLQAAVLLVKLEAFKAYELEQIQKAAKVYDSLLQGKVQTPFIPQGCISSYAQYTLKLENAAQRNRIQAKLKEAGIPGMVYYPAPLSKQKAFAHLPQPVNCPTAEALCSRVLSLPIHPYLTEEEAEQVAKIVLENL